MEAVKWSDIIRDMATARRCPHCGCRVEAFVVLAPNGCVAGRFYTESNAIERRRKVGGRIVKEVLHHCRQGERMKPEELVLV